MSNPEERDQGLLYVVVSAAIGLAVLGAVYWRFRSANTVASLADHANVGNAMAPAVAFLTLLAVVAALWSVQIQRTELALQRQELRETREEMVEQRKQFERTAAAQERLATAQSLAAGSQRVANRISLNNIPRLLGAEHAQRMTNVATLMAAIANVMASVEAARDPVTGMSMGEVTLEGVIRALQQQRDAEAEEVKELERLMSLVATPDEDEDEHA